MKKLYVVVLGLLAFALLFSNAQEKKNSKQESAVKGASSLGKNGSDHYFLHISDIHLDLSITDTDYGLDTGKKLWANAKEKLKSVLQSEPAPKFVIYTGDLPAHYSGSGLLGKGNPEFGPHNRNISSVLTDMRDLVSGTDIPLFYVPGNNDSIAGDYRSFADAAGATPFSLVFDPTNPYPAVNAASGCDGNEPPCIVSNPHPKMGYYSAQLMKGLRLIALNSIIFGKDYYPRDGIDQVDAGDTQLAWLGSELKKAAGDNNKIYIAMHIPPGADAWAVSHHKSRPWMWRHGQPGAKSFQERFLTMTETYKDSIAGILYGHTHMDEVRRLYDSAGTTITEVAIAAPGITPQHNNNPGFKTVFFAADSMELTDFVTYYTTPKADSWSDHSYQFSDSFGCDSGSTIFDCLKSQDLSALVPKVDNIYTVMNKDLTPFQKLKIKRGNQRGIEVGNKM